MEKFISLSNSRRQKYIGVRDYVYHITSVATPNSTKTTMAQLVSQPSEPAVNVSQKRIDFERRSPQSYLKLVCSFAIQPGKHTLARAKQTKLS